MDGRVTSGHKLEALLALLEQDRFPTGINIHRAVKTLKQKNPSYFEEFEFDQLGFSDEVEQVVFRFGASGILCTLSPVGEFIILPEGKATLRRIFGKLPRSLQEEAARLAVEFEELLHKPQEKTA